MLLSMRQCVYILDRKDVKYRMVSGPKRAREEGGGASTKFQHMRAKILPFPP